MSAQPVKSAWLAWRDWRHERLLTLCAVLALASMLAPILVLQGLKNGVVEGMRARLLEDPAVLIITPKSDAGKFNQAFIDDLRNLPQASFAIGRTRETVTDVTIFNPVAGKSVSIGLEPASDGEPVLKASGFPAPLAGEAPQIILSAPAAAALGAKTGDSLDARLGRRTPAGKFESTILHLKASGILPAGAADRRMGFMALSVLEDMENYRDYVAVPSRGYAGNAARTSREYASFRLYARSLDDVEELAAFLSRQHIEVNTRARDIAAIRSLEAAVNQVILIVSIAVGAGFAAFTVSSVQGSVSRKRRMLGMLRLLGFRRPALMTYPITMTMLTSAAGFLLSLIIYWLVSLAIEKAFTAQGALHCLLPWPDILVCACAVFFISLSACMRAAFAAAKVEPSQVLREI